MRDTVRVLLERFIATQDEAIKAAQLHLTELERTRYQAVQELDALTPVETPEEAQAAFRRASEQFEAVRPRHDGPTLKYPAPKPIK